MDKIIIKNLDIFAYHGVFAEEKENGQRFVISAELDCDLRRASFSDELADTVSYAEVCELINKVVTSEKYDLIEAVCENICSTVLLTYEAVKGIRVKVVKPNAPIDLTFDEVAVELYRKKHQVYLSIGSNLGDREEYLDYAIEQLGKDEFVTINQISTYIETKPYGPVEQPDFLNGALSIETLYSPSEILSIINDIEKDAGRKRIVHWGPRTLDIDILLYDDEIISTPNLQIPHVEMANRDFVLEPMSEIAPYVMHPVLKKTMSELWKMLQEKLANRYEPYIDESYKIVDKLPFDEDTKVVFAGVPGAYAEAAMFKFFGEDVNSYHVMKFQEVVNEVCAGNAAYGIIPIENSSAGFVSGSYDIIRQSGVKIVAEVILDIEHALLGLPDSSLSEIKKVYSHIQGLQQCKDFIDSHGLLQASVDNTALAAKKVKESGCKDYAAIASERAAELYGLKVLARRINFNSDNSTKFAVVAKEKVALSVSDKISICFSAPHKCGSLYKIMGFIMENGLNMTNIESRPSLKKKWEYYFYVNFEGKLSDANVQNALGAIKQETEECIVLGTF